MAEEARQALIQEEMKRRWTALEDANNLEDLDKLLFETWSVSREDLNKLDQHYCKQQPKRTVIGLTVEKASEEWPGNKAQVIALVKKQIKGGADFVKSLNIESKRHPLRGSVEILLDIIFSESNTDFSRNNCNLEGLASKAASNRDFLSAIDGLYEYYHEVSNDAKYKSLEIKRKELKQHKSHADPYFRSLKWLWETSTLFQDQNPEMMSGSQRKQFTMIRTAREDVFLGTFQLISDIRSDIHGDTYLQSEYQKLSDQAEEFLVALIDEVQNDEELAIVIKMEGGRDDVFYYFSIFFYLFLFIYLFF
jgi:hypothetical protein